MEDIGGDPRLSQGGQRFGLQCLGLPPESSANRALSAPAGIGTCLRYYHTVRHLRPVQIYGRVWHRLVPSGAPEEGSSLPVRPAVGVWCTTIEREPTMLGPKTFRFLNRSLEINTSRGGWHPREAPEKLWLLNLHYFDDLNSSRSDQRQDWHFEVISNWITENPPAEGIGWGDAYALSLRIVNWIKWHLQCGLLSGRAKASLVVQVRHLVANIETYLLGNHLLANAKALIFAGCFFRGPEAERWLARGLELLERELLEEILPDGGHYERSPMYHGILLEDLLDLFQLSCLFPSTLAGNLPSRLTEITTTMRAWLKAMSHPDGEITFFNDAALGIAPNAAALERYALALGHSPTSDPGEGLTYLDASGYARFQRGPLCAFVDVGEIGPDHIPGHAHADTLSFELSIFGRRVLVNSGTSTYKIQPSRQQERGTAAHNTVTVDGKDSSEVWGAFRVARRARPREIKIHESASGLEMSAAHDGYRRLPGRVMHRRTFCFADRRLSVTDILSGSFAGAEARFHFHPGVSVGSENPILSVVGEDGDRVPLSCTIRADEMQLAREVPAAYRSPFVFHPEFGLSHQSQCLVIPLGPRVGGLPSRTQFFLGWD